MAEKMKLGKFWIWVAASLIFRLVLIYFPNNLNLASRPEVSTPITSLRRLAEGYWLRQASLSPYAGSMYHGSPLLLSVLGPLTVERIEGQPNDILCSLVFVIADVVNAMLIRVIGQNLQTSYNQRLKSLGLDSVSKSSGFSDPSFLRYCCSYLLMESFHNCCMCGFIDIPN
ncbi:GPI transamidase subunit PIG-U [Trema orientale]|uniref:GPI transamidase subunit PIG-U n=1 Tax=Trema orientale TaxID=63057 RepID=A0A2P5BBS0_TREOI|nr:GPI transamidase subunit PIG-U [Trema orientale]